MQVGKKAGALRKGISQFAKNENQDIIMDVI